MKIEKVDLDVPKRADWYEYVDIGNLLARLDAIRLLAEQLPDSVLGKPTILRLASGEECEVDTIKENP